MRIRASWMLFIFSLLSCTLGARAKVRTSGAFQNNGDGTFSYVISIFNAGQSLICCQAHWQYLHPSYGAQNGGAAICAYPGKSGSAGPHSVIGTPTYTVDNCWTP